MPGLTAGRNYARAGQIYSVDRRFKICWERESAREEYHNRLILAFPYSLDQVISNVSILSIYTVKCLGAILWYIELPDEKLEPEQQRGTG